MLQAGLGSAHKPSGLRSIISPEMGPQDVPVRPDLAEPGNLWEALEPRPWSSSEVSNKAGLKELALKQNPVVGYWDPLNIGDTSAENIA